MFKKDRQSLSLPLTRKVRGIEIKKMPIGAYLSAVEKIKGFPDDFLMECFPGKSFQEIIEVFSGINEGVLSSLLVSLFTIAPKYIVSFIAELCGIDEEIILYDPSIGLDGFVEILTVFIEVNCLGEFVSGVKELKEKMKALKK